MMIGDVGGIVSASVLDVFACAEHAVWIPDWQWCKSQSMG
jgi:hypothetical protein